MRNIQKAILKTLAFFDLSQRPLCLDEIWQFLHQEKASKIKVLIGLQNLEKIGLISKKDDLYFLKDKETLVKSNKTELIALTWKKAEKFAKYFRYTPFVQNVSVAGSLANGGLTEKSDINLVIIARKHRSWLAKTFITAILEAFGQNKNRWYRSGKFSVDFVLDESRLDLSNLKFKKDDYAAYWLANLTPIFDRGAYKKLIAANSWIHEELPNWQEKDPETFSQQYTVFEKFLLSDRVKTIWERLKRFQRVKTFWEYLKNKSRQAEIILVKKVSNPNRREYYLKCKRLVGKVGK